MLWRIRYLLLEANLRVVFINKWYILNFFQVFILVENRILIKLLNILSHFEMSPLSAFGFNDRTLYLVPFRILG